MTGREAFTIWAPPGARWADWVRPVPFVATCASQGPNALLHTGIPGVAYIAGAQKDTAVIVDVPGADGVMEGLALARLGFRPVPLYNGTRPQAGALALVDNDAIELALQWGARELAKTAIPPDAPPAFLLDSNRLHRHKMNVSVFDNSWDIYAQDMPSAKTFLRHGIRSILVRGAAVHRDLRRILYGFQKKGIAILHTDGYAAPKKVILKKPPRQDA